MHVDRNGLEVLDRQECLRLLRDASFGRVGISSHALPVVLPVTYRLVDEDVVFTTAPGAKLQAATDQVVIAFEIDHIDPISHTGWSVLVTGVARHVDDEDELARLRAAGVPRWLAGDQARYVVLSTEFVSGRRLVRDRSAVGAVPADGRSRITSTW
jgi:uncharacterized protein